MNTRADSTIGNPPDPFPEPPRNVRTEWFYAFTIWRNRIATALATFVSLLLVGYLIIILLNSVFAIKIRVFWEVATSIMDAPTWEILLLFLLMGFWTIIGLRDWWIRPYRLLRLYRFGTVARGVVVSKRRLRADRCQVTYAFQDQTGSSHTCQLTSLGLADRVVLWSQIREGQAVTVLYDPNLPSDSTVYELGNFIVH